MDASGEPAKGRVAWPGPRHEFTAGSAAATLCFELRSLRDRSDAARSQLGKPGSRYLFASLGSVRPAPQPSPCRASAAHPRLPGAARPGSSSVHIHAHMQ